MKDLTRIFRGLRPMGFLLIFLILPGCGKEKEGSSKPQTELTPSNARSSLQAELDRLQEIPRGFDPGQRAVPVSLANTNRRDWALQVLERGYVDTGHTNRKWDEPAHRALQAYADYSRAGSTDDHFSSLTNAVRAAIAAGCDDPFIGYMRVRYGLSGIGDSQQQVALAYVEVFRKVYASRYHPLFKFYVGNRAIEAAREADHKGNRSSFQELVTCSLEDLVRDTNAPAAEVFDTVFTWVDFNQGKGWTDYVMVGVQPNLEKSWGQEEAFFRLRGKIEFTRAWEARGTGFADSVSEQSWAEFRKHLEEAERSIDKAWQMNSSNAYTAYLMMEVELGQGQGRERMEQWLSRAMAIYPGYYDAVKLASYYLEPRWYGSEEDALQFARSCVSSTNWVGRVPLVLPDTHRSLAAFYKLSESPEYWHRPGVWEDVRDGYEKFFKLNPGESGWRHNYARDAYLCGHYQAFLEQTKLFAGGTNYAFFGGEQKFRDMLAKASVAK